MAGDRSVRVVLSAQIADFQAKMAQAKGAVDGFAQTLTAHSQSADVLSSGLLKIGTVAALGFGFAVKTAADFEKAMSNVKATGSDAAANFDALRDAAIDMGAKTAFSATEAAAGVENLMKAGVSAKDVLGGGLKGSLDLAAAGSLDVGSAAEIAATALTQFGLAGADVPHVADLLAAGAGKAQGEVYDLGMALKQSGLVAAQFGLSIEETVGGLSAFAAAGLLGSDAGTSLKTMLQRMAAPSKEAAATMKDLGIAAYDASGNFVGLEGLAGQLQAALSKLTPAQRDAALATIFGSDAVRAANVLYKNGASGIAEWTAKVNDQGYAAETAATKLDNLKGDLEALGGSLETVLIKGGTGANEALRGLTQGATGLVNAIGSVPAPVLQAGVALVGLVGAGGLAAGGLLKAVTTTLELRTALADLAVAAPKASGALAAAGKAAGVLAAAMAAAAIVGAFDKWRDGIRVSDDLAASMIKTGDASKILNEAFQFKDLGTLPKQFDGIGASLQRALNPAPFEQLRDVFNDVFGASTATKIKTQFGELDRAMAGLVSSGRAAEAATMFDTIAKAAAAQGISLEQLAPLFTSYTGALRTAGGAATDASTGAEMLAGGLGKTADAATLASDAIRGMASLLLQLSGSQMGLEAAIDGATDSLKEHGKNLDINTEAGRANQTALDGIAAAALSLGEAQVKAGASAAEMDVSMVRARESFISTATQMGMTRAAAEQLATSYGLIPTSVITEVSTPGATVSKAEADALNAAIQAIPPEKRPAIVVEANTKGAAAAQAAIDAVQSKTVTVTVKQVWVQVGGPIKAALAADGGLFAGSGPGLIRQYKHGGFDGSFRSAQPQIRRAGGAGVLWAEEGAGPWEGFVSGHPGKRSRSRVITEEIARRLGGDVQWQFADGGLMGGGKAPVGSTGGASLANAVRAALNGAELRLTGAVDTIGDAVAGRILLAYEGAV